MKLMKHLHSFLNTRLLLIIVLFGISLGCLSGPASTAYARSRTCTYNTTEKITKDEDITLKLKKKESQESVTFQVANSDIVSIVSSTDHSCTIRGLAVGKTYVTAYTKKNGRNIEIYKCTVRVTPPAVSVRFRASQIKLCKGERIKLRSYLNLKPKYTSEVPTYQVSDESILTVNRNGKLVAKGEGSATVTASIRCGKSDTITIYVSNESDK